MATSTPLRHGRPGERRLPAGRAARQRGMTLIELMVGVTIGLLVVLAAVGSLLLIRGSSRTVSDGVALEQQAALVMMQIGQQISQAGAVIARPTSGSLPYITFDTSAINGDNPVNTGFPQIAIFGTTDTVRDAAGYFPDKLTISYTATNDGGPAFNCLGSGPSATKQIVSQFSINRDSLNCGNGVDASQPIASNVIDMAVNYLQVGADGNTKLTTAGAGVDWTQVKGVQVCLEMQGNVTETPAPTGTRDDCRGGRILTDGLIHRVVKHTYYLRNIN